MFGNVRLKIVTSRTGQTQIGYSASTLSLSNFKRNGYAHLERNHLINFSSII